jgi:hypothetical protein
MSAPSMIQQQCEQMLGLMLHEGHVRDALMLLAVLRRRLLQEQVRVATSSYVHGHQQQR